VRYWIAAQAPPLEGGPDPKFDVLSLAAGREAAGRELEAGDLVLVYQSRSGRAVRLRGADGSCRKVRTVAGRMGIVAVVEVLGRISHDPEVAATEYADGTELCWSWRAPTVAVAVDGSVPLREVNRILGFKPTYGFGGFAYRSSGLRQLEARQYWALAGIFRSNDDRLRPRPDSAPQPFQTAASAEEQGARRRLVEFVAADPARALREAGLETLAVAHDLPAGDSADIVLEDRAGAVIAVQVCAEEDWLAEIAHASLRRAMLELEMGRRLGESRVFVIAHSVSQEIQELCASYGVETFVVDRELVQSWNGHRRSAHP
jgi:hypothetical protein